MLKLFFNRKKNKSNLIKVFEITSISNLNNLFKSERLIDLGFDITYSSSLNKGENSLLKALNKDSTIYLNITIGKDIKTALFTENKPYYDNIKEIEPLYNFFNMIPTITYKANEGYGNIVEFENNKVVKIVDKIRRTELNIVNSSTLTNDYYLGVDSNGYVITFLPSDIYRIVKL